MIRLLRFVSYFIVVSFIANFVYRYYNPDKYFTPNREMLKVSHGHIFSMSKQVRAGNVAVSMQVKLKDGESIPLTCSLYGRKECYEFKDIHKHESFFNQLAYQEATVWWLPIKHRKLSGRVYQIEQNGKIIVDFDTFDLRYRQEAIERDH